MNTQLLIDSLVRQTTVLLGAVATSRGLRAPLVHIADQVFLELANELDAQGLSRKVSADMFGMALRSYRRRIQRLKESSTDRGKSLWEAVLSYIASDTLRTRREVLQRFRNDDEASVRSILTDLCDSNLLFQSGKGPNLAYRAVTTGELAAVRERGDGGDELLWVLVYREGPLTLSQLVSMTRCEPSRLEAAVDRLSAQGRLSQNHKRQYQSSQVVLQRDDEEGWQAAIFDHYQALVRTLSARLRAEGSSDTTGGSTYTFDVWPEHPLRDQILGTLARLRNELGELWEQLEAHNTQLNIPENKEKVTVYFGQSSQKDAS